MKLVLVRGLPGSGKSTYAKGLHDESGKPYFHVEADMYFMHADGIYRFNPTKLGPAHDWCQLQCARALERGESCVVSNTFVKRWEMMPYLKMAKTLGADVEIVTMTGQYGSVHNIPAEVVTRMAKAWESHEELLMENSKACCSSNKV